MSPQELIPIEEAAAEFGVHRTTIFRHITEGRLDRYTRMGDRRTFVDRWAVQGLVEDPSIRRCLQLIYDRFREKGEWPLARDIQRELDRQSSAPFDFLAVVETLPQELGWRVRDIEGHTQLTLRGIARCENSGPDVEAFLALIRTCHEVYVSGGDPLDVKSSDVAEAFGWGPLAVAKMFLLIQVEAGFWTGLGKTADGWVVTIDSERIRHFRDVRSVSDYLAAKQRAYQPRGVPSGEMFRHFRADAMGVHAPSNLHPTIAEAVGDLRETPAVMAAATALEKVIADRIADDGRSGSSLIARYFETALRGSPPDARRLEALRSLALSAFGAYRNPAAHRRMEFVGPQAQEIVGLFSLLAREIDNTPMPAMEVQEIIPWVPFGEARAETLQSFVEEGRRRELWKAQRAAEVPADWYCDVHLDFIDRGDVGIAYGEGVDPIPVCPRVNCAGRGWGQVRPMEKLRSPAVGARGQSPKRAATRISKKTG